MNKILLCHQISSEIINLIDNTKDYCYIITPYMKLWNQMERSIEKAGKRGINIGIIVRYGESNTPYKYLKYLNKQYDFDIYFINNLHTKLYLNESTVILSSMNLYDTSNERNYEIGYLIDNKRESKEFLNKIIVNDILSLNPDHVLPGNLEKKKQNADRISSDIKMRNQENRSSSVNTAHVKKNEIGKKGFCIRCSSRLATYNPNYPFCYPCYSLWNQFENWDYSENYCCLCGEKFNTSRAKPICDSCFCEHEWARTWNFPGYPVSSM